MSERAKEAKRSVMQVLQEKKLQRKEIFENMSEDDAQHLLRPEDRVAVAQAFEMADEITKMLEKPDLTHPLVRESIEILTALVIGISDAEPRKAVQDFLQFAEEQKAKKERERAKLKEMLPPDLLAIVEAVEKGGDLKDLVEHKWPTIPPEQTEEYEKQHSASGIQEGDMVEILSKAQTGELGWVNSWTPNMDRFVGQTVTIHKDHGKHGFQIAEGGRYCFPCFVMQKVAKVEGLVVGGSNGTLQ